MARVQGFMFVWKLVRHRISSSFKNKALHKCDYYIIYLLLHIKHVVGDIKSYFRHSNKRSFIISTRHCSGCFPFQYLRNAAENLCFCYCLKSWGLVIVR